MRNTRHHYPLGKHKWKPHWDTSQITKQKEEERKGGRGEVRKIKEETSWVLELPLVVPSLRICLVIKRIPVQSLVQEDPRKKFFKKLNTEIQCLTFLRHRSFISRYIPKRNEKIYPYKNMCMNVHSSIINRSPKVGIPKYSFTGENMMCSYVAGRGTPSRVHERALV